MNTRQVATGTFLTASLLLGGGSIAEAGPGSRPAQDQGDVCEAWEHRLDGLGTAMAQMERRRARLTARLDEALADGDARRVRRLETQIAQVDRVVARLQAKADRLTVAHDTHCEPHAVPE
ncbi:MAG TPA: hypothetical protein VD926_03180 [Acidimicrobiales bacterium]|nr:hypothetical protein [Acidimicrobiales bacterium]